MKIGRNWSQRLWAMLLCLAMLLPMVTVTGLASEAVATAVEESTSDVITVVAGSDFQYSNSDHGIAGGHVENILSAMKADGHTSIDGFLFAGDYSQAFTVDASKAGSTYLKGVVSTAFPDLSDDNKLWLQGNHDPDSLTTDGTLSTSGAHDAEDYGVFLINEKDYMWYNNDETAIKTTAANLRSYLNAKSKNGYTKPIFVVSHLQLHYSMRTYNDGDGKYANYLFDVLNEAGANGLNIIFMFGHNHSNGWDDYLGGAAVYLTKGDNILIAQNSNTVFKTETLNFTYMNAGYVGYYSNVNTGAETDLTMTMFQITDDEVTIARYTSSGIHDLKSVGVTNAYKSETAYGPDTRVYTSTQTLKLNKTISTSAVTGVKVNAAGITEVHAAKGDFQIPEGYNAYESYDIAATGYNPGDIATITLPVSDVFDSSRYALVIDHKKNTVLPVEIDGGEVTFTANHLGMFTLAQADVRPISGTGTVGNYLRLVAADEKLEANVPYVIVDSKITDATHWMLTTQEAYYTSSSSGITFQGLLLEDVASPTTEYIWYYDNGNLRAKEPTGDNYLLISYNGDYNGTQTDCVISVGAYDQTTAAVVNKYSDSADSYQIKYNDDTNVLFLQRRGGENHNVATTYTVGTSSNSLWHFYEVVTQANLSVTPSQSTVALNGSILMQTAVTAGTGSVSNYTITWSSDDESIATVSADGKVTPKKAGQIYINATLTSVDGNALTEPATVSVLITVVDVKKMDYKVTATTVFAQKLGESNDMNPDDLAVGGPYAIVEYYNRWILTGNQMLTTTEGYNGQGNYEGLEMVPGLPLYGEAVWYIDENGIRFDDTDQYLVYNGSIVAVEAMSDTNQLFTVQSTAYGPSNGWDIYYLGVKDVTNLNLVYRGGPPYNVASKTSSYSSYWVFYSVIPSRKVQLSVSPMKKTVLLNQTTNLNAAVTVDGTAASDYMIGWTTSDMSVATVDSNGNVTAVSSGNAIITATLISIDGVAMDGALSVEIPVQVAGASEKDNIQTVTMDLPARLQPVTELKSGQAYLISSYVTGNWVMTNAHGYSGVDASYQGLVLEHLDVAGDDHLWYYVEETVDGVVKQYLRYGAVDSGDNYMVCNNRVAGIGAATMAFDSVTYDESFGAFIIMYSSSSRYLNQHGGWNYNVAVPSSHYGSSNASRWRFNTFIPEKELALSVDTAGMELHANEADKVPYSVTLDGIDTGNYSITWTSSDSNIATVSNGIITAVNAGSVEVTATLTHVDGLQLDAPIIMTVAVTVSGHEWKDASCTTAKICTICGATEGEALGHSYESVVTAPTCTVEGYTTYTCDLCGHSYTDDVVAATGHSWVDATCTDAKNCSVCGVTEGEALEHPYETKVIAPTCTDKGYTIYSCPICGDGYLDDIIEAIGHSWVDATCTDAKYCSVCGTTEGEALSHSYESVVTVPTCTDEGYTTYTCTACGHSYTDDVVAATGHSWIDATCTDAKNCSVCGTIEDEALGHNYESVVTAPTCTEDGYTTHTCTVCGDTYTDNVVSATGHSWVDATCTDAKSCSVCGTTEGEALGHSYESVVTAPTCTAEGYTTYTCTACGHSYTDDVVAATGHSWIDATCTDAKYCSVCGTTEGEALGHSYESVVTAPTCTDEGYTTYTCTACGHSYTDDVVAATGHSWIDATCTDAKNCSVCGTTEGEALGHSYESVVTAPTCTDEGYTTYTCTACGHSYTDDVVAATGHSYSDGYCTSCGSKDPDYVESVVPTLTLNYPTLSFEDKILYNVYYSVDDATSIVDMGLLTFATRDANGSIDNAKEIIPGYLSDGTVYMVQSNGIAAKDLGDALYFKIYAELTDGSYIYSDVSGFNAIAYANSVLNAANSTAKAKALVVAMLNYGAAAQIYFDYKADSLMNAGLTAEQLALVDAYDSTMVADVVKADASKVGSFVMNGGYSNIWPTVSFEGAFAINFYFTPDKALDAAPTMYYWDAATYNSVDKLTPENATGVLTMKQDGSNWGAAVEGIAAKQIDETVYVAGFYTSNGVSYPTSVIAYSLGAYCKNVAANGEAFGAATAVYGYYAKAFFS